MKRAILFLTIILLLVLIGLQLAETAKNVYSSGSDATAEKLGPINFETQVDESISEDQPDRFSIVLSVPTAAPTLPPIPTPTPVPSYNATVYDETYPYKIIVDIGKQVVSIMTLDEDGNYENVYRQFRCSTGLSGTPTVIGNFKIRDKNPWLESYGSIKNGVEYHVYAHYRTTIYDDYHFHSILYEDKRGFNSLLRTSFYNLGRKASHGCVRLLTRDAKWIYMNCDIGTPISIVTSGGPDIDEDVFLEVPYYRDLPSGVYFDPSDVAVIEKIQALED